MAPDDVKGLWKCRHCGSTEPHFNGKIHLVCGNDVSLRTGGPDKVTTFHRNPSRNVEIVALQDELEAARYRHQRASERASELMALAPYALGVVFVLGAAVGATATYLVMR